jgi:hypothetical protein
MNTTTQTIYLQGHTCKENAYEVKDYPYGFKLRTSIFYWIETKAGKGDRLCTYTINPKNGRPNAPKYSTYSTFMYMYLNEQGHVTYGIIDAYDIEQFEARFEFILNKLDILYITQVQQDNIRINHYQHIRANAIYELNKYSIEKQPIFKQWVSETLRHIKTCEFVNLIAYSPKPIYDNE